jgi:hypothetical protein
MHSSRLSGRSVCTQFHFKTDPLAPFSRTEGPSHPRPEAINQSINHQAQDSGAAGAFQPSKEVSLFELVCSIFAAYERDE